LKNFFASKDKEWFYQAFKEPAEEWVKTLEHESFILIIELLLFCMFRPIKVFISNPTLFMGHPQYVQVILGQFFPELTEEERLCGWFQQDSATAHPARTVCLYELCPMSSGTELSAVVFGQHVNRVLIFVGFPSEVF
jgi:hypothetical protein